MNAKKALIALLGYAAVLGFAMSLLGFFGVREPLWLTMILAFGSSLLMFWWFCLDTEEHAYRRTPLLNVAVVAIGFVAIPYYMIRSRARGERLKAVAKCIGFGVLWFVAVMLGALPMALIAQV